MQWARICLLPVPFADSVAHIEDFVHHFLVDELELDVFDVHVMAHEIDEIV